MKLKKVILTSILFVMMIMAVSSVNAANVEPFHNFTGLYLKETKEFNPGDKVAVEFYGFEDVTDVKIHLKNDKDDFVVDVEDFNTRNPYFILPEKVKAGVKYEMSSVEIYCEHGKIEYSTTKGGKNFMNTFEQKYVTVKGIALEPFHNFTGLYIKETKEVNPGDKVLVDFYGGNDVTAVKFYLKNDKDYFTVDVKDFNTRSPYFIVPGGARAGVKYEMTLVEVYCEHGKIEYSTTKGGRNFMNTSERKYITIKGSSKADVRLTALEILSEEDLKKGDKLYLNVQFEGSVSADFVTMVVENKNNPKMFRLLALNKQNGVQYLDLFAPGGQAELLDGEYYISDVFVNPDKKECVRFSNDVTAENAEPLTFNAEFRIDNSKNEILDGTDYDPELENTITNEVSNDEIENVIENTIANEVIDVEIEENEPEEELGFFARLFKKIADFFRSFGKNK